MVLAPGVHSRRSESVAQFDAASLRHVTALARSVADANLTSGRENVACALDIVLENFAH